MEKSGKILKLTEAGRVHDSRVVFIDLEVVTRDDALEDKRLGAHFDDAARRPAKTIFVVVLDPIHLFGGLIASQNLLYHAEMKSCL